MRQPALLLCTFLFVLGNLTADLHAATVTLEPVADVELRQGLPTTVVSGSPMIVGGLGVPAGNEWRRGLLRFDVSGIPTEAIIVRVELTMEVVRVPDPPENSMFELRRMLVDWTEAGATWNSREAGVPWTSPGALAATDAADLVSATALVAELGSVTFASTPELVADVQGWLSDPPGNRGWLMRSQAEATLRTARHFASREASNPATRPRLSVTFVEAPELTGASRSGDGVQFEFAASAGVRYRIETRESLSFGMWELQRHLGPFGNDQVVTVQEPLPDGAAGVFVRVGAE